MEQSRQPELIPSRNCDGCAMCCKTLSVRELAKPPGQWCAHCVGKSRCGIYDQRPLTCASFYCGYLFKPNLDERWKPSRCKMVLTYEAASNRVSINVDPSRIDAWRKEPFFSEIRRWAIAASQANGQVVVWEGVNAIAILPNREKPLGEVRPDQFILNYEKRTAGGIEFDAVVVDRDHPAAAAWLKQKNQQTGL